MTFSYPLGATVTPNGTHFRVWAASVEQVDLVLFDAGAPGETLPMEATGEGYFELDVPAVGAGTRYMYRLNGSDNRPDPTSRFQPEGVHGPSEVVDPAAFHWNDSEWCGIPVEDAVIYELHIGTFTPEGTFDAAIAKLDELRDLGVSAIQIMPVADFPGDRNWGYDGVCLFAPARAYGGPEALRRLVDAAHTRGLAVFQDVVYNHLGPDGNYLSQFSAHYFTNHHKTPWGDALNFDDVQSEQVRAFFIANAQTWAHEFHMDGLRLDATHAIKDDTTPHILAEIVAAVHASLPAERHFLFIAEDERNEPRLVRAADSEAQTYGLDAVWADDFHHELRVALTGEREGYYADYLGNTEELATTLRQGWFYTGQTSEALGHQRGAPADDVTPTAFLHCIQNHDQVGNRALGDRLNAAIGLDAYRMASALLLGSPYLPMLWQGQEWAASTPFLFFTHHNPELGRLVTEGRRREFAKFTAFAGELVPDPQAESTFTDSKLNWAEREQPPHNAILRLYRDLLHLRRTSLALRARTRDTFDIDVLGPDAIALAQRGDGETLLLVFNLRGSASYPLEGAWDVVLSTEDAQYGGNGGATYQDGALSFSGPAALVLRQR